MKPIRFKGTNIVFGENQPEYKPLPALLHDNGIVETRWSLGFFERIGVLFGVPIYHYQLSCGKPLQPVMMSVKDSQVDALDQM